jgi:hypothetical protein
MTLSLPITGYGGFEFHPDDVLQSAKHLSQFQVEKFTYLFNKFFDLKKNGLIEHNDIDKFTEQLRLYTGWTKESDQYRELEDVNSTFYECITDQVKAEFLSANVTDEEAMITWEDAFVKYSDQKLSKSMNIRQWLNMWGRLTYGSAGMADFPIWVQLLPEVFFKVIDRDEDGLLSYEEVKHFYKDFIGITDPVKLEKTCREGYRAMTATGDYKLTKDNYDFVFANFLLGKDIYGPGKYLFGTFDNREMDEKFPVRYNEEDEE